MDGRQVMKGSEIERIRAVYARRSASVAKRFYSPFDSAHLLLHFSRQRAFLNLLKRCGIYSLDGLRVLEVGCGSASLLLEYMEYGAKSFDLFGVDLLWEALIEGHTRSPNLRLVCADGRQLPFADHSFDLVTLYTVFSSVLDAGIRQEVAAEAMRVAKGTGLIVLYDFWPDNPKNPAVKGLKVSQAKALFPDCHYDIRRIVLAPPIARRLAPISPLTCQVLERLPLLCTHYLAGIIPRGDISRPALRPTRVQATPKPTSDRISIRPMSVDKVYEVVDVHLRSFPGFFLSFLGPRFLRLFYESVQRHPRGVALVATSGDRIEGFVVGVTQQIGFYQDLVRKKKWAFAGAALGALLRRPSIAPRLARALRQPEAAREAGTDACLMSVAVRPESEGLGIGRQLVEAFCQTLSERGADAVSLTTDRDNNERVNRFYSDLGFRIAREYLTPEGRAINEYVASLPRPKRT